MFGSDYRSDLNLVFCHPDNNYIWPDVVKKAARRIAKKAGLAGVSLHPSVTRTVPNCSVLGFHFQRSANISVVPTFT
jgi:hypothetical protein